MCSGTGVVGLAGFILNFSTLERVYSWYELGDGGVCGSWLVWEGDLNIQLYSGFGVPGGESLI